MRLKILKGSFIIGLVIILIQGCDFIQIKTEQEEVKPLARAKTNFLYPQDIEGIVKPGTSKEDSVELVQKFIEDWARKQLLIEEAEGKIDVDEAEIERKILDYRYSLIGYEYMEFYINNNLNTEVSDEEIEAYYEKNVDNFMLKQNIIRGLYVKTPVEAPNTRRLKRLIQSNKPEDFEELKSYCLSFATQYQLYDSVWMVFEDVVKNSPLADIPNKVQFLKNRKFVENADDSFLYYLKIDEYRISDNISPVEFVKDQIISIILNKRKVELAKELEDNIYENAVKNKEFEIYN
ncbi:MAG: peptidylprolyl isomerase [Cyclobacteriaceae bacterium]|nr:peptidylprolyl isomerase [Cyclobacteriaceae bacterium]